ncbi:MAG: cytochrome c [Flavobacteriales bacterium]|nr:cytochrome c [Flavobacteriales bacterium]
MNKVSTLYIIGAMTLLTGLSAMAQDGEAVFKQNCSACHKLGTRLVGPDLNGVIGKRSEDWVRKFIAGSQTMVKAGDKDAVAISDEFNKMVMPDFALTGADLTALIGFLASTGQQTTTAIATTADPQAAVAPIVYTDEDVVRGRAYFQGGLSGGGPACVSCHNATGEGVIPGGLLAKDLTNVFARMGHAGIAGILGAPPFPAMSSAYSGTAALTDEEVHSLAAFFEHTDKAMAGQVAVAGGQTTMLIWGSTGLVVILALIGITWKGRLRRSVRHEIDSRQLRSI